MLNEQTLRALQANYRPSMMPTQQATQPKKKGNLFTNLLPTAGSILGGIAGTFAAPGVGTAAGGAGGAVLGTKLRNWLTGQEDTLKDYATEGAFGALGGIGKAAKTVRALPAARRTAQAGSSARDILRTASQAPSLASKVGEGMRQSARGLNQSGKIFGSEAERQTASKVMNAVGLKGSARKQYQNIGGAITNLGTKAQKRLAETGRSGNATEILGRLSKSASTEIVGDRAAYQRALSEAQEQITRAANKKGTITASDLYKVKQDIGERLGNAFKKLQTGGDLTPEQQAFMATWKGLDDEIIKLAPKAKALTKAQSVLIKAQPVLDKAANARSNAQLVGTTIPGRTVSRAVQSAQDRAGRILTRGTAAPKTATGVAKSMAKTQIPARILSGNVPLGDTQQPPLEGEVMPEGFGTQGYGAESILGGQGNMMNGGLPQQPQSMYSREAVAQDIQNDLQRTGGANMDKYIKLYEFLNPEASGQAKPGYGRPTAQQYSLATAGLSGVDQLESMLASDPNVLSRTATPGQGLPIIGGLISNLAGTGEYQATSQNVLDAISRARTGAAMTENEERFYTRLLPRAGDSPATIQNKLALLRDNFSPFIGYGQSSAVDILSELGLQ